ncbi:hypothetical protein F5148DRAFT_999071 [Russula earlei]|uniref:Uncharacterized protein n=1 Tax=Russula earlei TaxID=71964 RepID=A0ACC0U823_9AGAM|nr:hypothetical protein F5148DRAFT_999071 [Russula earlei]
MATSGPPQPPPPSSSVSAPQPPPPPANPDQITWDGDKMFNIYILDYCKKRGYHKTANQLVTEADIPPESKPPINAQQGLLFEWWSVFWVLFQAKNSGNGSEDALLYHKVRHPHATSHLVLMHPPQHPLVSQHQNQIKSRASQIPPPGVPHPQTRYSLPNGAAGPVPPLPNPHMNGIPVGQPQSLSATPYGHANPATQPNGMPVPPPAPPGHPGPPFSGPMLGRPPLGPQQRLPNGASQYHSPTIAPSPQSGNPQQPPAGPMGQLGRSPHLSTINRAVMLPPNGPQPPPGSGPTGGAHPTPTLPYQQVGRPPSGHDASSQNPMNPHPSPAMSGRIPPGQERSHMDNTLDAELATYPPDLMGEAKLRAGVGDRDAQSLTLEEKQSIIHNATRIKQQNQAQNSGVAGPSGTNMHGQMPNRGPMPQPMQQQMSMQQQRVAKRSSTSPGEEVRHHFHWSYHDVCQHPSAPNLTQKRPVPPGS